MPLIMCFKNSKILVPRFLKQGVLLLFIVEAITSSSGIQIIKDNKFKNNSTNFLDPTINVNYSDNNIIIPTKLTTTLHSNHELPNTTTTITKHNGLSELWNSSRNVPTEKVVFSTSLLSTSFDGMNRTTVAPSGHHKKTAKHSYRILLYILIPVSVVVLLVVAYFMIRHIQRVKRKRRLERELIHQYSYPNSEAGDIDDGDRLFEVESIINAQFHGAMNDQEEKNFAAEIPEVIVSVGDGPRLVVEEEDSPLIENEEVSTSFNC